MKHLQRAFYASMVLLALLAACAPQATPIAPTPTTPPPPTQPPTLVPVPTTAVPPTATLKPIVLSGPPMEVGSMWPYVDGSVVVAVPAGPFTMGHGGSDNPEHTVTLSDYWIYQGKVTNQQYALCVKAGKCKTPDLIDNLGYSDVTRANDPVVGVTWDMAAAYCGFVHGALPTEAQWEKAARGPNGLVYPWGNGAPSCDYLNFNNCVGKTTNIVTYPQGQSYYHGLDLEGNAYEWVADWYNALYYKSSPNQDPLGPDTGQMRSVRSASYRSNADQVPASTRRFELPNAHSRELGFRCVVLDPTYFAPMCSSIGLLDVGPSGSSGGGQLQPDCPTIGIGLTSMCKAGLMRVTFTSDDPSAQVGGVGSCFGVQTGSFPKVYDCASSTTATLDANCTFTSSGSVQCSNHYTLDTSTGMCVWDGTGTLGTQCLPGYNYDPVNQCCSVQPGTGTNFPVCPNGTALGYVPPGNYVCVPQNQAVNSKHKSELVVPPDPASCTGGGVQTGGSCSLTNVECTRLLYDKCGPSGAHVDTASCSCLCN